MIFEAITAYLLLGIAVTAFTERGPNIVFYNGRQAHNLVADAVAFAGSVALWPAVAWSVLFPEEETDV